MYGGIEHAAIAAQNTLALCNWYCETFGFEVVYRNQNEPPTIFVKLGESLLELIPANEAIRASRESADPGLSHFAIGVDDFDAAVSNLGDKGIEITGMREASGGVKVGFVADLEGNAVQIIFRPNPL